jgi:membrane protein YdbS with pleckstrin-like domain
MVPMPLSCVVGGRTWLLFSVEFTTADGEFSTYIYALSAEHAAAIVDELKQTARLGGQIEEVIPVR